MKRLAILFPGQGSQEVGMGARLAEAFAPAAQRFEQANDLLGYSLSKICFEDPQQQLNQTEYAQPALYTTCLACWDVLTRELGNLSATWFAGHSLGEFTALHAANSYSFEAGLQLVHQRANLMAQAGQKAPGGMAVIIGSQTTIIQQTCLQIQQEHGYVLVLANDNAPGQAVVSGDVAALEKLKELKSQLGYKLFRQLPISVACHSPRMSIVQAQFDQAIDDTPLQGALPPLIANTTASPIETPEQIRAELKKQLCGPVRWQESILALSALGIDHFLEIGPGEVLTGLVKRILPNANCAHFSQPEELPVLQEWLRGGTP